MSGFAFPPPPPPPPSNAPSPGHQPHGQRGGLNGRGSRGRGRGNARGGFNRGGSHEQHGSLNARQNFSAQPSPQHGQNRWQDGRNAYSPPPTTNAGLPSQNGLFHAVQRPQQAMNFPQSSSPNLDPQPGIKRTHNQAFNHGSLATPQNKPGSKPKTPAAPSIPSFGFSLAPVTAPMTSVPAVSEVAPSKKKQRKHNVLGLTPKGEVYENSDDDVDEEALFAQSGQSGTVSYRGRSIQLNTAADVAAWIAERKKNFPTAARIAVRKAAQEEAKAKARDAREAEKRRRQEEREKSSASKKQGKRLKKENSKAVKHEGSDVQVAAKSEPSFDDPLARIAQLEAQLRQAREALAAGPKSDQVLEVKKEPEADELIVKTKEDPESVVGHELPMLPSTVTNAGDLLQSNASQGLGLDYSSDVDEDVKDRSEVSSEDPSSESSASGSDDDSDSDAPPEEESTSSRGPINVRPPPREGPNKTQTCYAFANTGKCKYGDKCMRSHDVPCRFYAKHGHCRYGDKCRMSHDVTPGTGKKGASVSMQRPKTMSLRERMIENELKEEAMRGLQVIKQLGASGFFSEV